MAKKQKQENSHPEYNAPLQVTCNNCGTQFTIGSTSDSLPVNICSQCHPAYTKKQDVFVDTSNRISRFMSRQQRAQQHSKKTPVKPTKKKDKKSKEAKAKK